MRTYLFSVLIAVCLACPGPAAGQGNGAQGPGGASSRPGPGGVPSEPGLGATGNGAEPGGSGNGSSPSGPGPGSGLGDGVTNGGSGGINITPGDANGSMSNANGPPARSQNQRAPASTGSDAFGPGGVVSLTPDQALEAVRSRRAAPLAVLAETVAQRGEGEIIDADLLQVGEMLVYAIKVLNQDGKLSIQYYFARTGRYIGRD